jgi:hypothetical protein
LDITNPRRIKATMLMTAATVISRLAVNCHLTTPNRLDTSIVVVSRKIVRNTPNEIAKASMPTAEPPPAELDPLPVPHMDDSIVRNSQPVAIEKQRLIDSRLAIDQSTALIWSIRSASC